MCRPYSAIRSPLHAAAAKAPWPTLRLPRPSADGKTKSCARVSLQRRSPCDGCRSGVDWREREGAGRMRRAVEADASAAPAFGTLLREQRLALELTQATLAERAGLSVRGIQDLERGVSHPYPDTYRRLVAALGLQGDQRARFEAAAAPRPRRLPSRQPAAQ